MTWLGVVGLLVILVPLVGWAVESYITGISQSEANDQRNLMMFALCQRLNRSFLWLMRWQQVTMENLRRCVRGPRKRLRGSEEKQLQFMRWVAWHLPSIQSLTIQKSYGRSLVCHGRTLAGPILEGADSQARRRRFRGHCPRIFRYTRIHQRHCLKRFGQNIQNVRRKSRSQGRRMGLPSQSGLEALAGEGIHQSTWVFNAVIIFASLMVLAQVTLNLLGFPANSPVPVDS